MSAGGDPRLAIVAALPEELAGVLARLSGRRAERRGEIEVTFGRLGGEAVALAVTGDGAGNAERGSRTLLASLAIERLVVVGVAGGLTGALEIGGVLLATSILSAVGPAPAPDRVWVERAAKGLRTGAVYSADRIAASREEKAALAAQLGDEEPAVVDLESATFARVAAAAGVPFLVLRAVSDGAEETLAVDFERFRGAAGGVDRARLLRYAAARPAVVSALLELRRRVALCAGNLASALEAALAA